MPEVSLTYIHITESTLPELTALLTNEHWEFFGRPTLSGDDVSASWRAGDYAAPENEGFLIQDDLDRVLGMLRLFDLQDPTALFDIRLSSSARGVGLGTIVTRWIAHHAFQKPSLRRLEANTRSDNWAMRTTLIRCGFVKEGHHRAADPGYKDWVTYCLLRADWETGTTTLVDWNDEPPESKDRS